MPKNIHIVLLLSLLIFISGCALAWFGLGAGIGVGTYRYVDGALERDYAISYDEAWEATNTALANKYISVMDSMNEGHRGKINAIRKDGTKITIKLRDKLDNVTSIKIRVGFLGSGRDAEKIHEEISSVAGLKLQ
jgi:hypothetical protein